MASTENSGEAELRQQLREAWQQIADLQWQLQAEQRNSRRQEKLIATQDDAHADTLHQHEEALADRDQELADLEDTHTGLAAAWQTERQDTRRESAKELAAARQQPVARREEELQYWTRHFRVLLAMTETLNETEGDGALLRVVEEFPEVSVEVQLDGLRLSRNQLILSGLLLYNHLVRTSRNEPTHAVASLRVCHDAGGDTHVELSLPNRGAAAPGDDADAIWKSLISLLRGRVESDATRGRVVHFS